MFVPMFVDKDRDEDRNEDGGMTKIGTTIGTTIGTRICPGGPTSASAGNEDGPGRSRSLQAALIQPKQSD
jgi:hypothetical protein